MQHGTGSALHYAGSHGTLHEKVAVRANLRPKLSGEFLKLHRVFRSKNLVRTSRYEIDAHPSEVFIEGERLLDAVVLHQGDARPIG